MFKSIIYLVLFISTHGDGVDCSTRVLTACAADQSCKWQQGNGSCLKLNSTDCTSGGNCIEGCIVTAPIAATCKDPKSEECGSAKTSYTCGNVGGCSWSAGACRSKAGVTCEFDGAGVCPANCEVKTKCGKKIVDDSTKMKCSELDATIVTECAAAGCETSGESCTGEDYCKYYSTSLSRSACMEHSELWCTVEGASCVVNTAWFTDNPEFEADKNVAIAFCPTLSTTPTSECDLYYLCKASGTECIDKTPNEICNLYAVALNSSECAQYSDCCTPHSKDDWCTDRMDLSEEEEDACITNIDNPPNCGTRSVKLTISECTENGCVAQGEQCLLDSFNCAVAVMADGKCTDEAVKHGCLDLEECIKKDCGAFTSEDDCDNSACLWDPTDGNCLPDTPLGCVLDLQVGCDNASDSGCNGSPFVASTCAVPSVPEGTCTSHTTGTECEGTAGCKWRTAGGSCVATGYVPPTEGGGDSDASVICSHFVLMILMILLLL